MPLFDEEDFEYLEDELKDETVDETADEEVLSGPLDSLASIEELRKQLSSATSEAVKNREVLEQIQAARLKLLEAPSRKEALMGLAQKLAAPRAQTDPRFYERQNLYTFLRDVGEYGQEQKQAEIERQAKIAALKEMGAKYGLTEAQKTQEAAMRGLTSLAQRQMMIEAQKARAKSLDGYSPSEGRQYVFKDPEAAGVASGRAPQVFKKDRGYGYIDDQDNFRQQREAPTGTRVVTSGALNPASVQKFDERQLSFEEDKMGLEKLQSYFKNVSSLDRGFKNLANVFVANVKNFLGKSVDGKPFQTLDTAAKQQALLGALRLEILGPGVLTEIDAQRLINTLGGDILSGKLNPDLVASRLQDIYKEKHQRAMLNSRILKRDAGFFNYGPEDFSLNLPSRLGGDSLREKSKNEKPPSADGAKSPPAVGASEIKVPPQAAIDMLKANPNLEADFDKKYGDGASKRYLGK